jgi:MinD-like ATPase involved in chromosome partitioning or flagellar assembly
MLTVCWAAKGGSGTTVVAAALALSSPSETLLVDLAGDLPLVLGIAEPDSPGVHDWLASSAATERLASLELPLGRGASLLPAGRATGADVGRWHQLAERLSRESRFVVVDAGTRRPPAELLRRADHGWLVTRACYVALQAARTSGTSPTGVVLVDEPGHRMDIDDIESTVGAPVVARVVFDPAVARAVDAGLLLARLPGTLRGALGRGLQRWLTERSVAGAA